MRFDPESYETVDARLTKFYEEHEDGRVTTELLSPAAGMDNVVVHAFLWIGDVLKATGLASERRGGQGPTQTSVLEVCETSAIGRSLANGGYKAKKDGYRPSREEMEKAQTAVKVWGPAEVWEGPGQCPSCHCPEGKMHGSKCTQKGEAQ